MAFTGATPSAFLILVSGQIETATFPSLKNIYLKFCCHYGNDWTITAGLEEGISQTSRAAVTEQEFGHFCVNFPLQLTFKSSNPFGWPQVVLSAFGTDGLGNDVVRGYGAVHVPLGPGVHRRRVPMFVPESSSVFQQFYSWLLGRRPELVDARIVAQAEGREVTCTKTQGFVDITFNIAMKDAKRMGYDTTALSVRVISDFPLQLPQSSENATAFKPVASGSSEKSSSQQPSLEADDEVVGSQQNSARQRRRSSTESLTRENELVAEHAQPPPGAMRRRSGRLVAEADTQSPGKLSPAATSPTERRLSAVSHTSHTSQLDSEMLEAAQPMPQPMPAPRQAVAGRLASMETLHEHSEESLAGSTGRLTGGDRS